MIKFSPKDIEAALGAKLSQTFPKQQMFQIDALTTLIEIVKIIN